ncbi:hypothetical protein OKJ48_22210, partial [Streptomyces kunmingensis]|nr:hypothetical protein [Streptomyces kunmingensis]
PWCAVGAVPPALLILAAARPGLGPLWLWLPDVTLALCLAAAAGAATFALRLFLALRKRDAAPFLEPDGGRGTPM